MRTQVQVDVERVTAVADIPLPDYLTTSAAIPMTWQQIESALAYLYAVQRGWYVRWNPREGDVRCSRRKRGARPDVQRASSVLKGEHPGADRVWRGVGINRLRNWLRRA